MRFLGPGLASAEHTFDMTMYMLVGGLGTLLGPLLGAIAVPWLTQYLQFLQAYRFIVFGPILILLVIFVPHGIVGTYLGWKARRESREAAARAGDLAAPGAPSPGATPGRTVGVAADDATLGADAGTPPLAPRGGGRA